MRAIVCHLCNVHLKWAGALRCTQADNTLCAKTAMWVVHAVGVRWAARRPWVDTWLACLRCAAVRRRCVDNQIRIICYVFSIIGLKWRHTTFRPATLRPWILDALDGFKMERISNTCHRSWCEQKIQAWMFLNALDLKDLRIERRLGLQADLLDEIRLRLHHSLVLSCVNSDLITNYTSSFFFVW